MSGRETIVTVISGFLSIGMNLLANMLSVNVTAIVERQTNM